MMELKLLNSCSCHTLLAQGSPVQETSGNLSQLEQELQTMAQSEQVAKEVEVAVGNAGVVYGGSSLCETWKSCTSVLELWSPPAGCSFQSPALHRLPAGLASSLSGLAVRCHKAMIRPQASESRKITGTSWP